MKLVITVVHDRDKNRITESLLRNGFKFTVMDAKDEVKLQLIDPRRFEFLRANPTLMEWYPGSAGDTGIPLRILERLGLVAGPGGESVAERASTLLP